MLTKLPMLPLRLGAAVGAKALAEGAAAMAAADVALDKVAMTLEASKPSSREKKKVVKRMVAKKPVAPKKKANWLAWRRLVSSTTPSANICSQMFAGVRKHQ